MVIRPANIGDCPALGRILVSATTSAFEGLVPAECLNWTPQESAANWTRNFKDDGSLRDGECIFVAESDKDGVVGMAMVGETRSKDNADRPIDDRYEYELYVLNVAPDQQRQGVGRHLVKHVAREVIAKGHAHLLVRVLVENPNRPFYERLGAVELAKRPYNWDGYLTEEVIYGWKDITSLVD